MKRLLVLLLLAVAAFAAEAAFDVASIKPNHSGNGWWQMRPSQGGRFAATNATVRALISIAFQIQEFQISGGPEWLGSDRYDVDAVAEENHAFQQLPPMLRALLEGRFQLKVHRETRVTAVYALVVAKNGPKLHPSEAVAPDFRFSGIGWTARKTSMSALTLPLAGFAGRPVLDETRLKGSFDFTLEWTPDPNGPSIFTAIQEQLGLKLEPAKRPVDTVIIDHVERPSEN